MMIIDCHAHVYAPDTRRFPVKADPLVPPEGVGSADHLRATSRAAGVSAVRAVQTVSYHGYDNRYLCEVSRENRAWVRGVVCYDPDDPASPNNLRCAIRDYGVSALRSIPSRTHQTFDVASVYELWDIAAGAGITLDLFLMSPELIPGARKVLASFQGVPVGFCHCMDLRPGPRLSDDVDSVLRLSQFANLHPKIDFIHPSGGAYPYDATMHDAAMAIIRGYGADRCLWGSAYPTEVWAPESSYAEGLRVFTEVLPLTTTERQLILGENARRLWFPGLADPS